MGVHEWSKSHAQVPIIDPYSQTNDPTLFRIYYNTRDNLNRTYCSFIDVDFSKSPEIKYVHTKPLLKLGKQGHFDDSGIMASSIVNHRGQKFLYYTGWNKSVDVSYRLAVGLMISVDNGNSFQKYSFGPILDRSCSEPITCSQPFVMIENDIWRMWYLSYTHWVKVSGKYEPCYNIKYAESSDGVSWRLTQKTCIDYREENEAIAVPNVWKESDNYYMMYSYRKSENYRDNPQNAYKLGLAISDDGIKWQRIDDQLLLCGERGDWESIMNAYPNTFTYNGMQYIFYNGNGFGKSGFGYALRTS